MLMRFLIKHEEQLADAELHDEPLLACNFQDNAGNTVFMRTSAEGKSHACHVLSCRCKPVLSSSVWCGHEQRQGMKHIIQPERC